MNENMKILLKKIYTGISIEGINKVLKRKKLKKLYDEYMR